tara:strand:- start:252 stop:383 length:132 start_codon:yes stop_codon:yes gene_type:complete
MIHKIIKLKLLKLTLISAFGVGVIATFIAKEAFQKKQTEDLDG